MTEARADAERFVASRAAGVDDRRFSTGLVGVPYDGAVTYRAGARGAPTAVRAASDSIESYCPRFDLDLLDDPPLDFGNFDVNPPSGGGEAVAHHLRRQLDELPDVRLLAIGGDHLIAYPFLSRALERHENLQIVHVDAHTDLRDDWEGERFNHATVMRRVLERMGPHAALYQIGIRSGLREEFGIARTDPRIHSIPPERAIELAARLRAAGKPIYVTLDVDGLDPSQVPGTGTPEPGGLSYELVERMLVALGSGTRSSDSVVVGADLVELAPALDPSGITAVVGARLARTLLLLLRASGSA